MSVGIIHKDNLNARARRQAEPERAPVGPVFETRGNLRTIVERASDGGPPIGSVDLRGLNYAAADSENWGRGVRLQDCVATVEASADRLIDAVGEVLREDHAAINANFDRADAKLEKLAARIAAAQAETLELRTLVAELQGEVADAHHQLGLLRASRGNGDASSLPTSLTTPRPRPAKRKRAAGATVETPAP